MHHAFITQAFLVGLLASAPLVSGFYSDVESRHVVRIIFQMSMILTNRTKGSPASFAAKAVRDVIPRHHTEAQIAAKEAAAAKQNQAREAVPPPDEFGPWDSTEDEFGSWVDKRDAHHTEAQIAAKEAAAAKKTQDN